MLVIDIVTGLVVAAPGETFALLGVARGDIVGQQISRFVADPDAADRSLRALAGGTFDAYEAERTMILPGSAAIPAAISMRRIAGREGRLGIWMMGLGDDAGRLRPMPYPEASRHLPAVVLMVDEKLRIDGVSLHPSAGFRPSDLLGEPLSAFVVPNDVGLLLRATGEAMMTGNDVEVAVRTKAPAGWRPSHLTLWAHESVGLVVVVWPEQVDTGEDSAALPQATNAAVPNTRADDEQWIGSTAAKVLEALRDADRPMSAADVAVRLGISRPTAQRYLANLAESGFLLVSPAHGSTGRPRNLYRHPKPAASVS